MKAGKEKETNSFGVEDIFSVEVNEARLRALEVILFTAQERNFEILFPELVEKYEQMFPVVNTAEEVIIHKHPLILDLQKLRDALPRPGSELDQEKSKFILVIIEFITSYFQQKLKNVSTGNELASSLKTEMYHYMTKLKIGTQEEWNQYMTDVELGNKPFPIRGIIPVLPGTVSKSMSDFQKELMSMMGQEWSIIEKELGSHSPTIRFAFFDRALSAIERNMLFMGARMLNIYRKPLLRLQDKVNESENGRIIHSSVKDVPKDKASTPTPPDQS